MSQDARFLQDYFSQLTEATQLTPALIANLVRVKEFVLETAERDGKVIWLGNGGSAGIASHLAADMSKNGGVRAITFSDPAFITCLANDYGFKDWMAHAIRIHAQPQDTLIAISSSGKSENILNAVDMAKSMGMKVATMSAMHPGNPLRQRGDMNLWIDSHAYNIVETVHQFWGMAVLDMMIGQAEYSAANVTELRKTAS
jgi:D-sedoheptulose 7-phosphate isomerase